MVDISTAEFEPGTSKAIEKGCQCKKYKNEDGEVETHLSLSCPLHWHYALIKQNEIISEQVDATLEYNEINYKIILFAIVAAIIYQTYITFFA